MLLPPSWMHRPVRRFSDRPVLLLIAVFTVAAGLSLPSPGHSDSFTVDPVYIAGGRGNDPGEFGIPESVILDSRGQIACTDKGRMMVHVFDRHTGEALFAIGGLGSDIGDLNRPNGIAVDSQGRILVVEQRNYRIQIFDADYNPLGAFGYRGSGNGGFQKPMGITIDSQDRIYVTDESRGDVQVFEPDGTFLWSFAKKNPRLDQVESIEIDEVAQRIYVCDEGKSRVNMYDLQGNYLGSFGQQGSGEGEFGNDPNAVRVDSKQRIWINDQGNTRINVYAEDTTFLASFYNSANGMESADGMELSEELNLLLVADQGNDRVLAFDLMALQLQLEMLEHATPASNLHSLTAHGDAAFDGLQRPLWEQTRLHLQAEGSGDASRIDVALVRIASDSDPRGILVPLVETAAHSKIFRGSLQLGDATDGALATLAAPAGDQLRAHLPGEAWSLDIPVIALPAPEIQGFDIGPGATLQLHRDPRLQWQFHDPAGVRTQDAWEIALLDEQHNPLWSSGLQLGDQQAFVFDDTTLPAAQTRHLQLRVRSGDLWSTWTSTTVRRNTPPPALVQATPADGAVLSQWPPPLRARGAADADQQDLSIIFETQAPNGRLVRTPPLAIDDHDWATWTGGNNVMENEALRWRALVSDGIEFTAGPWRLAYRNELEEPPTLPEIVTPSPDSWGHEDELHFAWTASIDPDPGQELQAVFVWRDPALDWNYMPAQRLDGHRWPGVLDDGPIEWFVIIQDPTGYEVATIPRILQLERQWSATLQARGEDHTSLPLIIGTRPGARNATIRGEDTVAPITPGQPQILSRGDDLAKPSHPGGTDRIVDFRRPTAPGTQKQAHTYDILLRGEPGEMLELELVDIDLPTQWQLVWRDANGAPDITLTPDTEVRVWLSDAGESFGTIAIDLAHEEGTQPVADGSSQAHNQPATRERHDTSKSERANASGIDGERTRISLQQHLSGLRNPLPPGIALLPSGLSSAVELQVFDARGRRVQQWRGHHAGLRAVDVFGQRRLPTGIYLIRARTAEQTAHRKVLWMGR